MWARVYLTFMVIVVSLSIQVSAEPVTLRLATTDGEPTHILARQILEKAYARAGIEVEFVSLPFLRSLAESNSGHMDGEVARLTVIEDTYPNLIRVPVKLYDLSAFAYATAPIPEISTWNDLKDKRLGLELGVVFIDRATEGMNRTFASSKRELAMLLQRGGVDLVVHSGLSAFGEPDFKFYRSTPLQTASIYHYLHMKNAHFVAPLARELQALMDEGVIDKLYREAAH